MNKVDNSIIIMLRRSQLHPHPDNPRKDLGDLEELKESIREHGIMQNLTVVPDEGDGDGYKILIGHRRFAASEGVLDELPCVIAKGLTDREQVGIMLCENMQRSDLTYLEQAHGFQMMMDLEDYLEKLERKSNAKKYRELFLSMGWTESENYFNTWGENANYKEVKELPRINLEDPFDGEAIKTAAARITAPVFFRCDSWSITFAIKNPNIKKEKKKTKEELLAEKRAACERLLNDKRIEMCDLYFEQITKISEKTILDLKTEDYGDITSRLCQMLINIGAKMQSPDKYFNIKSHCDYSSIREEFPKYDIIKQLMFIVWEHLSSTYENKLVQWNFTKNMEALKAHQEFYKILNKFGFRLEKGHYLLAVIDGTSDLYNAEVK